MSFLKWFKKEPKQKEIETDISKIQLPEHLGIIMDGNGRWAQKRGQSRSAGHKAGANNFRKIARYCSDIGIKHLTVYAFSTENWKRPKNEVSLLMSLFKSYLKEAIEDFKDEDTVLNFLGDLSKFPKDIQELAAVSAEETKNRTGMVLNLAMNYGGRDEIIRATKKIGTMVLNKTININDINEKLISENLYTKGQPDPDLIIRPSGEQRTSNFLIWQSAYAEYVFMKKLWPDFSIEDLNQALIEFNSRNRRFGGI